MNTLLTGLDKAGTVVKRKYSVTCLVRYNNDFVVGFGQRHPKYFNVEFLPLFICIYNLYTQHVSSPYGLK